MQNPAKNKIMGDIFGLIIFNIYLPTSVVPTGAGISRAAVYDVIRTKLRQIPYSNRFYKYF